MSQPPDIVRHGPDDACPDFEIVRLSPDDPRNEFSCGDADLDEFYRIDSIEGCKQLVSVTYEVRQNNQSVAFFSVSNDSIRRQDGDRKDIKTLFKFVSREKRYKSMPAAKIGRLGVSKDLARSGIGSQILDFLKGWFTIGNKTGCRFLIVDAYNKEEVIEFYKKNGFVFLTARSEPHETRLMYFDLILFQQ